MSSNIWVVSDTHFGHANILNFTDSKTGKKVRPGFGDVTEMNELMVQRWNEVVRPGDKVYHLGDVMFGDKDKFQTLWPRLMGSKRLIVGNHDDIKYLATGGFFQKIHMWRIFADQRIILSHVPLHDSSLERGAPGSGLKMLNVHGHIHQNASPKGPYFNASVENTNYRPMHIDELVKIAKQKLDDL